MNTYKNQTFLFTCTGKKCKKEGSKRLLKSIIKTIGKDNTRIHIQLVKTKCMNQCKTAPNIFFKDKLYKKCTEQVIDILISNRMK